MAYDPLQPVNRLAFSLIPQWIRDKCEQLRTEKIVDPKEHKTRHATGGDDVLTPGDIGAAPLSHGLHVPSAGTQSQYLRGDNTFAAFPESLPANGGNAATVGGLLPSAFAPSNFGLGTVSKDITNSNLNTIYLVGHYVGNNLANAPNSSVQWFFVNAYSLTNSFVVQEAFELYDSQLGQTGRIYKRANNNGTWSAWKQVATTDQTGVDYVVAQSLGVNGYTKWASGKVEQWGVVSSSTTGLTTVTFPIAFTAACRYVRIARNSDGSLWQGNDVLAQILSASQFKFYHYLAGVDDMWFAVGY